MLNGKRIFITTGGGVGDMIMFTPALRRLKELYPDCYVTFMTKAQTVDVVNRLPYIDKVIGVKRGTFLGRYRVLPELAKQDIVIYTDWQPHLLPWSKLFGIPVRAGFAREGKFISRFLTHKHRHNVMKSTEFAAQTNAKIFGEALGITLDGDMTHCDVSLPSAVEKSRVLEMLRSINLSGEQSIHPFVLLTPYSSKYERDWSKQDILEFIQLVKQRWNIPVVLAGITKAENDPFTDYPYNFLNKTTLMELVALSQFACYQVSVDSGPMHIAAAVGTSLISLFNKDFPSRWGARYNNISIYLGQDDYAMPLNVNKLNLNVPEDISDIRNISAQLVFDTFVAVEQKKKHFERESLTD